ncbi:MAG: M23 family metallopeptidase [Muribaculaceae bacterium]|nr:M23 family metallopeptidase [Muribaculaceae bacterium]
MAKNYKNPARFRLDFIKENTFNRVWSLRMTRRSVIAVTVAVVAAGAALLWCIMAYTPLRQLLPGTLDGDLRSRYLEAALRIDSLEQKTRINDAYLANIEAIMSDRMAADSARAAAEHAILTDSLPEASEAEKAFVRAFEDEARFNLSVLTPIAAEGMVFSSPAAPEAATADMPAASPGIRITSPGASAVAATYRGTVLAVYMRPDGSSAVTVQHPNDFISIYDGLGDVFVEKGVKVEAGQRIGHTTPGEATVFELWHKGNSLKPREYINF